MLKSIYLDHAATTPLDPDVLDQMTPWLTGEFGNADSTHHMGQAARVGIEESRNRIADLIGALPSEIIFTSGGTESNNAIIRGAFAALGEDRNRIITSPIEHHAVLHTVESLKRNGAEPVWLQPSECGRIDPNQVREAITDKTLMVSLMHVNNEIGTFNPISEIAAACRELGVLCHTDAVQSGGKFTLDVRELDVDFMSLSAHKFYGPKGIGLMYIREGSPWLPWVTGGAQERRRRGGTSNVAGAVGMAHALYLATERIDDHFAHATALRTYLIRGLERILKGAYTIHGPENGENPYIVNVGFPMPEGVTIDGDMLLLNLDVEGVCVSNGSACTSGAVEPSHVLAGIGVDDEEAKASLRISFGPRNSTEDIDYFLEKLQITLNRMKSSGEKPT